MVTFFQFENRDDLTTKIDRRLILPFENQRCGSRNPWKGLFITMIPNGQLVLLIVDTSRFNEVALSLS